MARVVQSSLSRSLTKCGQPRRTSTMTALIVGVRQLINENGRIQETTVAPGFFEWRY